MDAILLILLIIIVVVAAVTAIVIKKCIHKPGVLGSRDVAVLPTDLLHLSNPAEYTKPIDTKDDVKDLSLYLQSKRLDNDVLRHYRDTKEKVIKNLNVGNDLSEEINALMSSADPTTFDYPFFKESCMLMHYLNAKKI